MLGHVSIRVSDLEASAKFYLAALAPLSYKETRFPTVIGLGSSSSAAPIPDIWLRQYTAGPLNNHTEKLTPVHISFYVKDRRLVDEFHAAGIKAGGGGEDNGKPGERPWMEGYYGRWLLGSFGMAAGEVDAAAYVLDLDGNNIEVVCFSTEAARPK